MPLRLTPRSLVRGTEYLEQRRVFAAVLFNETIYETIGTAGDQDQYEFSLATPTRVYLDTLAPASGVSWSLARAGGPSLFADSNTSASPVMDLASGNYELRFTESGPNTTAYAFRLLDLSTSTPITTNSIVSGTLSPGSSTNVYRITANAGDVFNFDTTTPLPRSANWRLVGPLGNSVFETGLGADVSNVQATSSGTYSLLVEGIYFETEVVDYQFQVNFLGNNPGTFPGAPLTIGSTFTGSIDANGEIDNYAFTLNSSAKLYLDTLATTDNLIWSLQGPTGSLVSNRQLFADSLVHGIQPIVLASPGNYQLSIRSNGNSAGSYTLRMLNLSSLQTLSLNTPITGALNPATTATAYRFNAVAGQKLYLDSSSTDTQNAAWRLISPTGQLLSGTYLYSDIEPVTLNESGEHLVLIEGYYNDTGNVPFSFNVRTVVDGDATLALSSVVSSQLAGPGEVDQYRFTVATDTLVQFDTLVDLPNTRWTLRDGNGVSLDSRYLSSDWYYSSSNYTRLLAPGSYTLTIDADGDRLGPYAFKLMNLADATPLTPGLPVAGTLNPGAEADFYRFTATAGSRFYFNSTSSETQNALWRVVNQFGQTLQSTYLYGDMETLVIPTAGEYYLVAEGYFSDPVVNYSFIVQPITNFASVPLTWGAQLLARFRCLARPIITRSAWQNSTRAIRRIVGCDNAA